MGGTSGRCRAMRCSPSTWRCVTCRAPTARATFPSGRSRASAGTRRSSVAISRCADSDPDVSGTGTPPRSPSSTASDSPHSTHSRPEYRSRSRRSWRWGGCSAASAPIRSRRCTRSAASASEGSRCRSSWATSMWATGAREPRYSPGSTIRSERSTGGASNSDELQELGAGARVAAKYADHAARDHRHTALVHATGRHALVRGIDHDSDAARLQHLIDAARDLRGELLLDLEAARIALDDPGELTDADDLVGRQVPDVHAPDDRCHVMLAMRFERDVPQHDHLVVAVDLLERAAHILPGVDPVSREPVAVGVDDALRRVAQPLALRVIPCPGEQRAYRLFRGAARDAAVIGCGHDDSHCSGAGARPAQLLPHLSPAPRAGWAYRRATTSCGGRLRGIRAPSRPGKRASTGPSHRRMIRCSNSHVPRTFTASSS